MVDFTDNPYASAEVVPDRPVRPAKITVIGVFGIILGVMYVLGFCASVPAIIFQMVQPDFLEQAAEDMPEDNTQMKMQITLQREMNAAGKAYRIPTIIMAFLSLIAGSALIFGGIKVTNSDRRSDMQFFRNVCLACVFLLVVNAALTIVVQYANSNAVERALAEAPPGAPEHMAIKTVITVSLWVSVGFVLLFQSLQLAYLLVSRWILKSHLETLPEDTH